MRACDFAFSDEPYCTLIRTLSKKARYKCETYPMGKKVVLQIDTLKTKPLLGGGVEFNTFCPEPTTLLLPYFLSNSFNTLR
jgi:hypothetical protein